MRECSRRGGDATGLQTFARTVLGAHSEQAKRLTQWATRHTESDLDTLDFRDETDEYSAKLETTGGNLTGSYEGGARNAEELMSVLGLDPKHYRIKGGHASSWGKVGDQKISTRAEFTLREYDFLKDTDRDGFIEEMKTHAPSYDVPTYTLPDASGNLLEIMVPDLHIGKLAPGYTLQRARERFVNAIRSIVTRAAIDGVQRIVMVFNGDTQHTDHKSTTESGTVVEAHPDPTEVFRQTRAMLVEAIELARVIAPVKVLVLPGNHDFEKSYYLADSLYAWFHRDDAVEVVNNPATREYIEHGVVLLGFTHGKDESYKKLPMLMMRENKTDDKKVFQFHVGHEHHLQLKELQGVVIRWFRSPSENDAWHERKGYGAGKDLVGILWNDERGKRHEYTEEFLSE